jgi:hypothetical protein
VVLAAEELAVMVAETVEEKVVMAAAEAEKAEDDEA